MTLGGNFDQKTLELIPICRRNVNEQHAHSIKTNSKFMMKDPMKLIALAAGTLALAATSANGATSWNFGADQQGWTVTTGFFANAGAGIEPADANGTRAHDAAHPVAVLTSPIVNFNLANVSGTGSVIDILWEGGQGNQNGDPDPTNLAAVMSYNGGNTNNAGQKGIGFRNLSTGNYDFVSFDSGNGGGVETLSYTQADLVGLGIDPNANYVLDFYTTDDGGWGWTRLNEVNVGDGVVGAVPEPSSSALFALGGLALLFRRRR